MVMEMDDRCNICGNSYSQCCLCRKCLDKIFQEAMQHERDYLNAVPVEVAMQEQTGFLLGYSHAWTNIRKALLHSMGDIK